MIPEDPASIVKKNRSVLPNLEPEFFAEGNTLTIRYVRLEGSKLAGVLRSHLKKGVCDECLLFFLRGLAGL